MTQKLLAGNFAAARTVLAAAVMVFGLSQAASAATLTATLDYSFGNGSCGGGGGTTTCSITVTIDDGGTAGSVALTIDTGGLPSTADLTAFYFNSDPFTVLTLDDITVNGGSIGDVTVISDELNLRAGGDGRFDHKLDLPPPGDRFDGGEVITFHLSGEGITAGTFDSTTPR
jgi:hypothetical protein